MIPFVDPSDHVPLRLEGHCYRHAVSGIVVATIRDGIPRFVAPEDRAILESAGFEIRHFFDPPTSPVFATAVRRG
jgi:hypothetical protein